jgi:hypothetical protein
MLKEDLGYAVVPLQDEKHPKENDISYLIINPKGKSLGPLIAHEVGHIADIKRRGMKESFPNFWDVFFSNVYQKKILLGEAKASQFAREQLDIKPGSVEDRALTKAFNTYEQSMRLDDVGTRIIRGALVAGLGSVALNAIASNSRPNIRRHVIDAPMGAAAGIAGLVAGGLYRSLKGTPHAAGSYKIDPKSDKY